MMPNRNTSACICFLSTVFVCFLSAIAQAMSVNPVVLELQAGGRAVKSSLSVNNDGAAPIPVELKISRLEIDENGKGQTVPAQSDFLVFPPQATIAPGATQTFLVQWTGNPQITKSQSYIISVNQLPIKFPKSQSGMQIVFNFGVVVNVAPASASSALELVNATVAKDGSGSLRPQLMFQNKGNRHASLSDSVITLTSGQWTETLTPLLLRQMLGVAVVQPGKKRRFIIPIDLPPQIKTINARIEHRQNVKTTSSK
jgi:fimbrial chaperone protein